jgi:phosphoribosylamine--glycine ligase
MKILLVGNGGRENALAYKIANSESFISSDSELFCTLGNPGIDGYAKSIDIKPTDINELLEFAKRNKIDLTVVGPELPLSLGIVDLFGKNGLKIFGPSKNAAEIESSKVFAKKLMQENNIPTADFKSFEMSEISDSFSYLKNINYPVVIKADGLAAGKGVIIAENYVEAEKTIKDFTENKIFGESGENFIIEEFLQGYELSIFAITDGDNYILLPSSQDHKKIGEGDTGKNTGGMGAYAPADILFDEILKKNTEELIIKPVLNALKKNGRKYSGCLYCGLMISENEKKEKVPYVIEFNCRFGDPETQAVLPLLESDFLDLLLYTVDNRISEYKLLTSDKFSSCVVLSSDGYPDKYETGKIISGLDLLDDDCLVFHSGTKYSNNNIVSNGGRVLSIVCSDNGSFRKSLEKCYRNIEKISFENKYFRKDIGLKIIKFFEN